MIRPNSRFDLTKEVYNFFKFIGFLKYLVFLVIKPKVVYALFMIFLWFILKDRSDSKQILKPVIKKRLSRGWLSIR